MELMFNEQSTVPLPGDRTAACSAVVLFVQTYKEAEKHAFKRIRYEKPFDQISIASDFTLNDFCNTTTFRIYGGLLLGLARHPFVDSDSEEEARFVDNSFCIEREGVKIPVEGLGVVYLYKSVGISLCLDPFWHQIKHKLYVEGKEAGVYDVIAISHPDHCGNTEFIAHKDSWKPICLVKSLDAPAIKPIHLRDDHGKDTLQAFAERLCRNPYVVKVVNSLPYNPSATNFIHKTTADGLIEIVLTNTDKGLGLVLQSTGRNLQETEAIAEILSKEFS